MCEWIDCTSATSMPWRSSAASRQLAKVRHDLEALGANSLAAAVRASREHLARLGAAWSRSVLRGSGRLLRRLLGGSWAFATIVSASPVGGGLGLLGLVLEHASAASWERVTIVSASLVAVGDGLLGVDAAGVAQARPPPGPT